MMDWLRRYRLEITWWLIGLLTVSAIEHWVTEDWAGFLLDLGLIAFNWQFGGRRYD